MALSPSTRCEKNYRHPPSPSEMESDHQSTEECLFCLKFGTQPFKRINFGPLLNRALSSKYATKSNKPARDITHLIENRPVKWVVEFKDRIHFEEEDEYLKRYYPKQDLKYKLDSLLEYFKYHKDIPRLFMRKLGNIAINYFEKQKHISYKKIKRMLGIPVSDKTNEDTQREPTHRDLKPQQIMVLEGVSLSLRRTQKLESEANSQYSSKSLLNLMLQNLDNDAVQQMNISESWMSMTDTPKVVINSPKGPNPKVKFKQLQKQSSADQLNRQKVQGLLMATKSQVGVQNQKMQIKQKKEQQEQLIRQLINEGCMKKSQGKGTRPINMITAFNSNAASPQQSPKIQQSRSHKEHLLYTITQVPKLQHQQQTMIRNQTGKGADERVNSGRTEQLSAHSNKKVELLVKQQQRLQKFSQAATVRASLGDIKQGYAAIKKFTTQPYQGFNMRSRSFETIKNLSLLNSLNAQQQGPKRVDTFEELRARQLQQNQQSHRKSQTQYSEPSFSPSPTNPAKPQKHPIQAVNKLSQLISNSKPKLSQRAQAKAYQSQPSINININQLNMNHVNLQSSDKLHPQISKLIKQSSQSMHSGPKRTNDVKADFYTNNYYHLNKASNTNTYNSLVSNDRTNTNTKHQNVSQKSTKIHSKINLRQN